jgi:cytochrome P450
MDDLVATLVEERSRAGAAGQDIVSELLRVERAGQLARGDVESVCMTLLLAAGQAIHEGIYNCVYALATRPEIQARLRAEPGAIPGFIHEALRLYTPSQFVTRVTTRPVTVRGHAIPAGEIINLWLGSANRDEHAFEDPTAFKLDRPGDRQVAFGDGPHYCLGAALTLLEIRVILEELLSRMRRIEPATDSIVWLKSLMAFRPNELFIRDPLAEAGA